MKISVVMATYNGMKYLEQQLDSIKNQTISPDEVIISDDASNDGTFEYLQNYISNNSLKNWSLIKNDNNIGWINNFYKLFEQCSGDIVFCADQDDIWKNDKIELMTKAMESNPNILVLGGNIEYLYEHKSNKKKSLQNFQNFNNIKQVPFNEKFYLTHKPGCATCFRKSIMDYIIEMRSENYPHDRLIWNIGCLLDSAYLIENIVITQRRHPQSAMVRKKVENNRVKEIKIELQNILHCQHFLNKYKRDDISKVQIIQNAIIFFQNRINLFKSRKLKYLLRLVKLLKYYPRKRSIIADILFLYK